MPEVSRSSSRWLRTGDEAFTAMLAAIGAARVSVRLETYIFTASPLAERFRAALLAAAQRGVRVWVLVDAWGSMDLPDKFWAPVRAAGAECRRFNPVQLGLFAIRDHRKLLVCDDKTGFVGGFNLAPEYEGDGVARGWCDRGLQVTEALAGELAVAFDAMFARAAFRERRLVRWRPSPHKQRVDCAGDELLLGGPGRGGSPIVLALKRDLATAREVHLAAAYFLPPWGLRRALMRVARRGGRVQLLLAGQSDVPASQLASRSLYQRLLRAGVEIYEYQPQVLHAKWLVMDDLVYAGSANFDARSLGINYELMLRLPDRELAAEGRALFATDLAHARRIDPVQWKKSRTFWSKFKERIAYLLLARLDPYIARRQWRNLH